MYIIYYSNSSLIVVIKHTFHLENNILKIVLNSYSMLSPLEPYYGLSGCVMNST